MTAQKVRAASCALHHDHAAQIESPGVQTWVSRGTNFVVAVSEVKAGGRIARPDQLDEYMVFLVDTSATVEANGERIEAAPETLVIVPPGKSELTAQGEGQVISIYSDLTADMAALAQNAADFTQRAPEVAPLVPWPTPADGFKLRAYKMADHTQADSNMRIFRSTNLMVNVMKPRPVPRDVHKLSPHSHTDFEQGSLAIKGDWVHHVRYPWGPDMTTWRDDDHIEAGSPSLCVIPPKAVHTSRNTNEGGSWLFDIFAPPRVDFSIKPGAVANNADYPLPPSVAPATAA